MKAESDPVSPDEWLIRLVFHDRFVPRTPPIAEVAFAPRTKGREPDVNGLSLFRTDCVREPEDVLVVVPEDKRPRYGIVQIPVSLVRELGLTLVADPIPESPGHVVIPELNSTTYVVERAKYVPIVQRLAEVASDHILRRPPAQS